MAYKYRAAAKKPWAVFSKLENRSDALQAIKNASVFLCALSGAYTAAFIKLEKLVDAGQHYPRGTFILMGIQIAVFGLGGLLLSRSNSRALAVVLFLACVHSVELGIRWFSNGHARAIFTFGTLIQLLALWGSARAIEATFKLRRRFSETDAARTK